jgi:ABC-type uncharacterized transport system substrate-binding protein
VHWGGADIDYIRRTAAVLARSKPDVIVPYATRVLNAVRDATRDIPVVFLATSDPVGLGLFKVLLILEAISPDSCFMRFPLRVNSSNS